MYLPTIAVLPTHFRGYFCSAAAVSTWPAKQPSRVTPAFSLYDRPFKRQDAS